MEMTGKIASELEDRSIGIIKSGQPRQRNLKKKKINGALETCMKMLTEMSNRCVMGMPERLEKTEALKSI